MLAWIDGAGLEVVGRLDARPAHPRASDEADPLHAARSAEVTSLWRLAVRWFATRPIAGGTSRLLKFAAFSPRYLPGRLSMS